MPSNKEFTLKQLRLISQIASRNEPFLQVTACLNPEIREIIGYVQAFEELTGDTSLKQFIGPLQKIGMATWGRTELSDLGFKIGYATKQVDAKGAIEELLNRE